MNQPPFHDDDYVPFHDVVGTAKPTTTSKLRVNEINTQRFAAGARGGTTSGQGPALDAK